MGKSKRGRPLSAEGAIDRERAAQLPAPKDARVYAIAAGKYGAALATLLNETWNDPEGDVLRKLVRQYSVSGAPKVTHGETRRNGGRWADFTPDHPDVVSLAEAADPVLAEPAVQSVKGLPQGALVSVIHSAKYPGRIIVGREENGAPIYGAHVHKMEWQACIIIIGIILAMRATVGADSEDELSAFALYLQARMRAGLPAKPRLCLCANDKCEAVLRGSGPAFVSLPTKSRAGVPWLCPVCMNDAALVSAYQKRQQRARA